MHSVKHFPPWTIVLDAPTHRRGITTSNEPLSVLADYPEPRDRFQQRNFLYVVFIPLRGPYKRTISQDFLLIKRMEIGSFYLGMVKALNAQA